MKKLTKHMTLRITEEQYIKLRKTLLKEQTTKSSLMREVLNSYLNESCRKGSKEN